MAAKSGLPDHSSWDAQVLRMTVFTPEVKLPNSEKWWKNLTGEEPDREIKQPKLPQVEYGGPFGNGQLRLTVTPARIDWHYLCEVDPSEGIEGVPTLGTFGEVNENFKEAMARWIPSCPTAKRLAFGAILVMPTANREDGYELLGKFLHDVNVDPQARDFLFRINRPRPSSTWKQGELVINRISTWSVLWLRQFGAVISDDNVHHTKLHADRYGCRLELDINTSQDFDGVFNSDDLVKLFGELTELAVEFTAKGDVK